MIGWRSLDLVSDWAREVSTTARHLERAGGTGLAGLQNKQRGAQA
jgi:hypothetical protein